VSTVQAKSAIEQAHALQAADDDKVALYAMMVFLRLFEKRAYDLFLQNLVKGTSHLGIGQEAIAAGFGHAMRPGDWTFATYRGHNHTLVRGADPAAVMAELLGRANGVLHGKGGSMHIGDASKGAMGSYAIIGAHLPIAAGAAWSANQGSSIGVSAGAELAGRGISTFTLHAPTGRSAGVAISAATAALPPRRRGGGPGRA